jgi:hypothetical protein
MAAAALTESSRGVDAGLLNDQAKAAAMAKQSQPENVASARSARK